MTGDDSRRDAITPGLAVPPSVPPAPRRPLPILSAIPGSVLGLMLVLGCFLILLSFNGRLDRFLTLDNLRLILHNSSVIGVAALGMLLVIVTGGIDLSIGSVVALVTVVTMKVFLHLEERTGSTVLASLGAVVAGVASGGIAGLVNGLAVTKLKVSPFVVTLGMLSVARGLAVWLAERRQVAFDESPPGWVRTLGRIKHDWFFFDPGVWSVVLLALLMAGVMHLTVFGRYCYVLGANEQTARRCGIPLDRTRLWVYCIAGLLVGWAGILRFAHGSAGDPNTGEVLALDVIAAVVIGGASLSGGSGTVAGTMLGVLILGVLDNGVSFCNVPIEVKYVLIGVVVIANTALSQWQRRRLT